MKPFTAQIRPQGFPTPMKIGEESLLFAESSITGIPWIIGLIVYTGVDARIHMSDRTRTRKVSRLERLINKMLGFALLVLLILVVFSMLISFGLQENSYGENWVQRCILLCILYNNIIPISLFASMDIIRLIQVFFIKNDL
jgi:magnesium-transporting ATPase (P-type)